MGELELAFFRISFNSGERFWGSKILDPVTGVILNNQVC